MANLLGSPPEHMSKMRAARKPPRTVTCRHPERKHFGKGLCRSCYMTKWLKAHPDANSGREWCRRNPERARELHRRCKLKPLGITPEDYDAMWTAQGGRCGNLGCSFSAPLVLPDYRKGLVVDHCHATGKVRGLLCSKCNTALGQADNDPQKLRGLADYVAKP